MTAQIAAAAVGTVAFALLFGVPRKYYLYCAAIGGAGWLIYQLLTPDCTTAVATFFATIMVVFLARVFAVWERCPVTIFLVAGIFPIVPGAGIYWTAYYIVTNQGQEAMATGSSALKAAAAIVLAIVCIFELPQKIFKIFDKRRAE